MYTRSNKRRAATQEQQSDQKEDSGAHYDAMASSDQSQKPKRPIEQTPQKEKETSQKGSDAQQQETRQKRPRGQQPTPPRAQKKPNPSPEISIEDIKDIEEVQPEQMPPQKDTRSDSGIELTSHKEQKEKEPRGETEATKRSKSILLNTAEVNAKKELLTAGDSEEYVLMYELIERLPKFSSWMEWIIQYITWPLQWRRQLIQETLDALSGDFNIQDIERKWVTEPFRDIVVPTNLAFGRVLGIEQKLGGSLSELCQLMVPKGVIVQAALLISTMKGTWRAMLFHSIEETFLHLDDEVEEHRVHIEETIEEIKRFSRAMLANVVVLIAWAYMDNDKKKQLRRRFRPAIAHEQDQAQPQHEVAEAQPQHEVAATQ